MSYCRFTNTAEDLRDCLEHIDDDLEREEHDSRRRLIRIARNIVEVADGDDRLEMRFDQL